MTARRFFALIAACALCLGASKPVPEVEFVRVWPRWRDTDSFKRISEYFTDRENTGPTEVRRTHADNRSGYYFFARVKHSHIPLSSARFVLSIITPDSPLPKQFTFPAGVPSGEHTFEIGVTGADWKGGRKTHPVAWRLDLLSSDGHRLAWSQSFLWDKPGVVSVR